MTKRPWLLVATMTGSLSMILLDVTAVGLALPTILKEMPDGSEWGLPWIVNAYIVSMACSVALLGRLGDLIGKARAFAAGVVLFICASVACGFAESLLVLLGARIVQGLAAALMQPASSALVAGAFPEGRRGSAMAVYVGVSLLFMAAGPTLGGFITQWASWRWVFGLNVPIGIAALVLLAISRPDAPAASDRRVDIAGGILLLAGLPSLLIGLEWPASMPWLSLAGAILLAIFIRRQWTHATPLLHLRLFSDPGLLGDAILILLVQASMGGTSIYAPVFVQQVLGFEPGKAGVAMLPLVVPIFILVHVSGRLYDRHGIRAPVLAGSPPLVAGYALQALAAEMASYPVFAAGLACQGVGLAFIMSPVVTDALSRVSDDRRGQVSGVMFTLRQVGQALGIAGLALVVVLPAAGEVGAFTASLGWAYWGAAAVTAAMAAIAWRILPKGR